MLAYAETRSTEMLINFHAGICVWAFHHGKLWETTRLRRQFQGCAAQEGWVSARRTGFGLGEGTKHNVC